MADGDNQDPTLSTEGLPEATANIREGTHNFRESTKDFQESAGFLSSIMDKITGLFSDESVAATKSAQAIAKSGEQAKDALDSMGNSKGGTKLALSLKATLSNTLNKIADDSKQLSGSLKRDLGNAADALGSFAIAKGWAEGVAAIDQATGAISKIQEPILETQKLGLQIGTAWGQGFTEATGKMQKMQATISATIVDTMTQVEDVRKVMRGMSEGMDAEKMTTEIASLKDAHADLLTKMTPVNIALLVSKATGMDAAEAAGMYNAAILELNETAANAPKIFGDIAWATKDSGLEMNKVSKSIMGSAQALKMWGGTVGSVTPIFKSFSRSLGEGQKGFATELMEQYISGLKGMGLEMKALIGMSGAGAGQGALEAGYDMESALEEGAAGMEKITGRLIDMIQEKTGGPILSLQEAKDTGQLEKYTMQRQLLQQTGVAKSDDAAKQMMKSLKDISENGMAMNEDQKKSFGDLMKSGEQIAQDTASEQLKATVKLEATVQEKMDEMLVVAKNMLTRMGGDKLAKNLGKMAKGEMTALDFVTTSVKDVFDSLTGKKEETKLFDTVGKRTGENIASKATQKEILSGRDEGLQVVKESIGGMAAILDKKLEKGDFKSLGLTQRQAERFGTGREIQTKNLRPFLQKGLEGVAKEFAELAGKGNKSAKDIAKMETLKEAGTRYSKMLKQKTITRADLGEAIGGGGEEEEKKGPLSRADKERTVTSKAKLEMDKRWKEYQEAMRNGDAAPEGPARRSVGEFEALQKKGFFSSDQQEKEFNKMMRSGEEAASAYGFDFGGRASYEALPTEQAQQATKAAKQSSLKLMFDEKPIKQKVEFEIVPAGDGTFRVEINRDKIYEEFVGRINDGITS